MDLPEQQPSDELGGRRPRFHIPVYDDVLKNAEVWVLIVLLLSVIAGTFANIIDRNFNLGLWNFRNVEQVIYSMVFLLGCFGGVIAARRAKHIAIDAVTHLIDDRKRLFLQTVLQLVGGVTCFILMQAAWAWVFDDTVNPPGKPLVPGEQDIWWLSFRLWRAPVAVAFGLMSLHFFVNAGRFGYDAISPPAGGAAPAAAKAPDATPAADEDGGAA